MLCFPFVSHFYMIRNELGLEFSFANRKVWKVCKSKIKIVKDFDSNQSLKLEFLVFKSLVKT